MGINNPFYAHSKGGEPECEWQTLEEHLRQTAELSGKFAAEFGNREWGYLAGLWHDLGKYANDFQEYLRSSNDPDAHLERSKAGRVDHSTAGALWAVNRFDQHGTILAYLLAGHHAGLADYESDIYGRASLRERLKQTDLVLNLPTQTIPANILNHPFPMERPPDNADPAFWVRLLFSCVVDADFLDTESFYSPEKSSARSGYRDPGSLLRLFEDYMKAKISTAPGTKVNKIRNEVLNRCIKAAEQPSGIYTLTVPTGGGKTLSSLAFALHHAVRHDKRRIIYVIPYTSIIEQTADQFRAVFRDDVIEHHSNLDVTDENRENARSRLACENWDAPIIVTTSVQFFESLFASRTSRCRKLHNIVNSVVVLDEAQLLPPPFLYPLLRVLEELQRCYGVTLLFTTATQPALGSRKAFDYEFKGLSEMTEIMDDPHKLYTKLERVRITVPSNRADPKDWDQLASELASYQSVLCVVNRRDDCRELWRRLPEGTIHLSALMCGEHRSKVIETIKQRLKEDLPTRVVSTQLVEAGVDLDFPVVYRALAGLDSIAQAAGRCNREGLLKDKGEVIVFIPPSDIPPGHLRQAAEIGWKLMSRKSEDTLSPEQFEAFFRELYWLQGDNLDKYRILSDLTMSSDFRCSFRTAAAKFRLIDDDYYAPVIVRYGENDRLIDQLESGEADRKIRRSLQRYVVNIPRYIHKKLLEEGGLREIQPGVYVQVFPSQYDDNLGFLVDPTGFQVDDLII